MSAVDALAAILRGAHTAALASLFGTLVFATAVARGLPNAPWARSTRARLALWAWAGALCALALCAAWFVAQAVAIANTTGVPDTLAALPLVALDTQFGRLILVRLGLLLALLPACFVILKSASQTAKRTAPSPRDRVALATAIGLSGGALALQGAFGHAGAMEGAAGDRLLIAEALHALAAAVWLGALVPLLVCLSTMPTQPAARVARRFFPLGLLGVSVIAATSLIQAVELVGSITALVGTAYGRVALAKLGLFLSMLALAGLNRFFLTGRGLRRSVTCETVLAVAVLFAAGFLAHLTPGAHEQPVWPFDWRLNPKRPGPLLVASHPTSFFTSPTGFAAAAIVRGERLYQTDCASCHGANGQGNGPAAPTLPVHPADLTARGLLDYSDGDLFWLAGHAVGTTEDERWDLVDYLRAHSRGEFVRTSGRAVVPLRIPAFDAVCADGRDIDADDLHGHVVRIVIPDGDVPMQPPAEAGTRPLTIMLPAESDGGLRETGCIAGQEVREAFAILLGATSDALAGSQILIDTNGWLRSVWRPGQPGGWESPARLAARVTALAEHPLPADAASGHVHHH
jgi:putative copper export protein